MIYLITKSKWTSIILAALIFGLTSTSGLAYESIGTDPIFIFGIPSYNKNECIQYIFKKLIQNGFKVLYTHPNLFYI